MFWGNVGQVVAKSGIPFPHMESIHNVPSFGMILNAHAANYGHLLTIGIMRMCPSDNYQ
jgi:hypothetical protein